MRSPDEFSLVASIDEPLPFRLIQVPEDMSDHESGAAAFTFLARLGLPPRARGHLARFRGCALARLDRVLATGIDVEPPDAPIWVDNSPGKAWAYGGLPKVMLMLHPDRLRPTWMEVPADTPGEELARLRVDYPTTVPARDGATLWLSRLPEGDPRLASAYEAEHGFWIPGKASEALLAVLVYARPSQLDQVVAALGTARGMSDSP